MIKTLYKHQDGDTLVIQGDLSKQEIQSYKQEGYREMEPQVNKHGIPVCG